MLQRAQYVIAAACALQVYDAPMSLPAIAPRPLLIANGELDPRCPIQGLEAALEKTSAAYQAEGCPQNFKVFYQEGLGHAQSPRLDASVDAWLDQHLLLAG